jgi:hypothetical protein
MPLSTFATHSTTFSPRFHHHENAIFPKLPSKTPAKQAKNTFHHGSEVSAKTHPKTSD